MTILANKLFVKMHNSGTQQNAINAMIHVVLVKMNINNVLLVKMDFN